MAHISRKPRLTLDIAPLLEMQWTGIPVFTRRLAEALLRQGGLELEFASNLVRFPTARVIQTLKQGTGAYLYDDYISAIGRDYSVVDPKAPIMYPSNKGRSGGALAREASTVHDMTTLFMPDTHDEANVAHHLDHFADELASDEVVFCISEATRASLVAATPSVSSKTRLIYQYADWPDDFEAIERNLPAPRLKRYAVVVGTIEPRKNLQLLIRALALPEVAKQGLTFVVIGKKGWKVDAALAGMSDAQRKSLLFSGFVSEFVKYRLIKGAEFLIFPSLCEGFGIPALEAMSLGKPVLASRSSSLPEVVGEAGVYFDPFSLNEFAAALEEIANPRKLAELAPKALRRNAAFGPERMARPVVDWALGK